MEMVQSQLQCLINVLIIFVAFYGASLGEEIASRTGTADCVIDGVRRRHGENFTLKCNQECQCRNGRILCRSPCHFESRGPGCRILRKLRDCCYTIRCPNATANDACDTNEGASPASVPLDYQLPWLFRIRVQNGSQSGNCMAVLFDSGSIVASPDCSADTNSRIIHPPKTTNLSLDFSIQMVASKGKAQITRLSISDHGPLEPSVTSYEELHEINVAPFNETCLRSDCALHIEVYSPAASKFKTIPATQASPDQCRISAADLDKGIKCLEVRSQDYPQCVNLAGGVVATHLDDYFFLKGFVAQSPFLEQNSNGCDNQQQKFVRYYDFCSDLKTAFRDL